MFQMEQDWPTVQGVPPGIVCVNVLRSISCRMSGVGQPEGALKEKHDKGCWSR